MKAGRLFLGLPNLVIVLIFLSSALLWLSLPAFPSANSFSQGSERSIQRLESYKNDPLQIIDVEIAHAKVKLGEKFAGGDDWLKDASLTVKNVSDKPIIFIEIHLNFPETKASGNEMSFPIRIGHSREAPVKLLR